MNEASVLIKDARSGRTRRGVWLAGLVVIGCLASDGTGVNPPGEEFDVSQGAYGWWAAKDVGTTFTDGINAITVSPQARGPLRLISARPLMDGGGTLRVVGILARINPDMMPPKAPGSFQVAPGFPPTMPRAAGAVPVEGLIVQAPKQGEVRWIELQIGYEVVATGRSARRGVELVYDYEGARHRVVIPSYLAICAPSTVTCEPEYDT
ncbi:hypothetical protein [Micromonospora sp. WMMD710]|uniref:hypothetical protein n=1 Tax=Micromonospora sp. WMMD710 TaxID=3016085 RepID=UPI002417C4A3|nr:hypothetical protein [Micromonospora sp. WMMD710]MDG4762107.1 hypothetical protein [Micromonospora sp. WMMD710]